MRLNWKIEENLIKYFHFAYEKRLHFVVSAEWKFEVQVGHG